VGEPTLDEVCEEDSEDCDDREDSEDKEDNGEGYLSGPKGGVGGVGEREKSVSGELGLASCCQLDVAVDETEVAVATGAVLRSSSPPTAAMENMMRKERVTLGAWHTEVL
jgi:hypothetical protein